MTETTQELSWESVEEKANALTHGLGLVFSILGFSAMMLIAIPDPMKIACASVFGISLILLYAASTLYHSTKDEKLKQIYRTFDHCAIFGLIAGSYTPFTLLTIGETTGWLIFGIVWLIAFIGIFYKVFSVHRYHNLSILLYLGMGWMIVFFGPALIEQLSTEGLSLLIAGGLAYTLGSIFYALEKPLFHHAIWHIFVMAGSTCHYFAIYFYVLSPEI